MNGLYKVADMLYPPFPNMNAAKAKIDEYENLKNGPKLFDNEKSTHAKEKTD
jgi:hypothetical protein